MTSHDHDHAHTNHEPGTCNKAKTTFAPMHHHHLKQSPIDLCHNSAAFSSDLKLAQFIFDYYPSEVHQLENNGHTFKLNLVSNAKSVLRVPGYLDDKGYAFQLLQIHAHWGDKPENGSEHVVNGKGYAAEIHFVHQNTKYLTFEEAATHCDGLAVLGVFVEEGSHNHQLDEFFELLGKIPHKGDTVSLPHGFDVKAFLPDKLQFWAYEGSLTTPPFSECVLWTVFHEPIQISREQLNVLRHLHAVTEAEKLTRIEHIVNNVRPVQKCHRRQVMTSFHF